MMQRLGGVRAVLFYPWVPFSPCGAWTRFQSTWQTLAESGAEVTLAFFGKGRNCAMQGARVSYAQDLGCLNAVGVFSKRLTAEGRSDLRDFSAEELSFLLMYEQCFYTQHEATLPWLRELISTHDIVFCEYPMFAPILAEVAKPLGKPLVVTSHDLLFALHGKNPVARERLRAKECAALSLADARFFCAEGERATLAEAGLDGLVVPNAGDAWAVQPGGAADARTWVSTHLKQPQPDFVLFVGSAHGPNQEAALEFRKMARQFPKVSFVVVGACHEKVSEGNFVALGHTEERVLDQCYRGALAVVIPLRSGTGMSIKTFQALAYGKAVVATAMGWRGFTFTADKDGVTVEDVEQIPAALKRVLSDSAWRERLGQGARALAEAMDFRITFAPYVETTLALVGGPRQEAKARQPHLLLVDNELKNAVGHHLNYALSLNEAARARGVEWGSLIAEEADETVRQALAGEPVFTQGVHGVTEGNPYPPDWPGLRASYEFLVGNSLFADELEEGLTRRGRLGSTVFLPNATPGQLLGLALVLQRNPLLRTLNYVVLLRYTVQVGVGPLAQRKAVLDKDTAERYSLCFARLAAVGTTRIRLVSDSAILAKEYEALAKRPVEVMPIPHTHTAPQGGPFSTWPEKKAGVRRLVFLGDAREEKGFELLPGLVKALAHLPGVEFVFQAYVSSAYHERMNLVIVELERLRRPNLHLVKQALSPEAYAALLHSADAVLLPYDAVTYQGRTSGPCMEALCLGKPVVVSRGTWMTHLIGTHDVGVTFNSGQPADFARATQQLLQQFPRYSREAVAFSAALKVRNNPSTFVENLLWREPRSAA